MLSKLLEKNFLKRPQLIINAKDIIPFHQFGWFCQRIQHNVLHIDNTEIPYSNKAKYLEMTLDAKLHWQEHVKIKNKNST